MARWFSRRAFSEDDLAVDDRGYLGQLVLGAAQDVLPSALAEQYPPRGLYSVNRDAWKIADLGEAIVWLETELSELEARLSTPEAIARRRQED